MSSLCPTELRIIRSIVTDNLGPGSPFLSQLPLLQFGERQMTGTGYFVEFEPLPEAVRLGDTNTAVSTDLATTLPPPRDVAGFTLFINDGFITSFEGYMFGNVAWPAGPMQTWVKLELPAKADKSARS